MTYSSIKLFIKKHFVLGVIFFLLFSLFYVQRMAVNSVVYGEYNDDEYHTIHEGIGFLVHGRVENFRAQESVRWLVRLFYPYALVQMNTTMGGNVFLNDWQYPGHMYVQKYFIDTYDVAAINNDPNLRVLFFNLRKLYLLFVLTSFIPLLYFLYKKKYIITALGIVVLLGINVDLMREQRLFYMEPAMLAGLNLCLFAYLYLLDAKKISRLHTILYAVVCAFTVATKFSTLPFLLLPVLAILFIQKETKEKLLSLLIFFASFLVGYLLINFPAFLSLQSFNQFLHDLSSNFWQYTAGSSSKYTVGAGFHHLSLIVAQLEGLFGYTLYLLPLIILWTWKYTTSDEKKIILPIGVLALVVCLAISKQYVYLTRNTVPFYGAMLFVPLMSLDILRRNTNGRRFTAYTLTMLMLALAGNISYAGGLQSWQKQLLPSVKKEFLAYTAEQLSQKEATQTYTIGFSDSFFAAEPYQENLTVLSNAPAVLSSGTYAYEEKKYQDLPGNTVLLIQRVGNNKHLTNYILPKYFKENRQFGEYFIFFNYRPPADVSRPRTMDFATSPAKE